MRVKKYRKAQAILEMGIFGAIVLLIFGSLVSYMQSLNEQQYVQMQTFRKALKMAHDQNAIVSYTTLEDRQHASVFNPLEGQRTLSSANSSVHWSIPEVGEENLRFQIYDINGTLIPLPVSIQWGNRPLIDLEVTGIEFAYSKEVTNALQREDTRNDITTTREVEVDEDRTYTLYINPSINVGPMTGIYDILRDLLGVDEHLSHTPRGIPFPINQNYSFNKERTWRTDFE